MPLASVQIPKVIAAVAGIHGAMALVLERKKPVSREVIREWARRLRQAADLLDEMIGD